MAAVLLQTRITAILDGLTKAAVAEIQQLIEEDSAAFNREVKRRDDEIESLKQRLHITEKELKKVQTAVLTSSSRCSVGVQVQLVASDSTVSAKFPVPVTHVQGFRGTESHLREDKSHLHEERVACPHVPDTVKSAHMRTPQSGRQKAPGGDEEEFSSLEFEMKIEQVEEFVDQELSLPRADYSRADPNGGLECKAVQRDAHLWSPVEDDMANGFGADGCVGLEPYEQIPTEQCLASALNCHTESSASKHIDPFAPAHVRVDRDLQFEGSITKDSEYGPLRDNPMSHMTVPRSTNAIAKHRHTIGAPPLSNEQLASTFQLTSIASGSHVGSKPFRCEECGKGFTQRTRLITHKRIHTGEKPYHCQLCGKMFSRQDNCLRHVRLHSGQRW